MTPTQSVLSLQFLSRVGLVIDNRTSAFGLYPLPYLSQVQALVASNTDCSSPSHCRPTSYIRLNPPNLPWSHQYRAVPHSLQLHVAFLHHTVPAHRSWIHPDDHHSTATMGQGFSLTTLSAGSAGIDVPDLADLVYEKSMGTARFMKSIRARNQDGAVLVKVVVKPYPMKLEKYKRKIMRMFCPSGIVRYRLTECRRAESSS